MINFKTCPICHNKDFKFLFDTWDNSYGIDGEFPLYQCTCGVFFLNPQPEPDELKKYYPDDYYPAYGEDQASLGQRIRSFLEKVFFVGNGSQNKIFKFLLFPISYLLRGIECRLGYKILDYGCGSGDYLSKLKKYGLNVFGYDFNSFALEIASRKGINVLPDSFWNLPEYKNFFDVITLNHVFEHLPDPIQTLSRLKKSLKPSGTLILGVPNMNSLGSKIFSKNFVGIDSPRHLFLYNLKSLRKICSGLGFRIDKVRYHSLPCTFLLGLDCFLNKFRGESILRKDSMLGKNIVLTAILFPLTTILAWTPWADSVELWLRKE